MSQSSNTVYKSFVAGEDLSEKRYHFVTLDSGRNEVKLANASDILIGVLADFMRGTEGTPVTVAIAGTVKVKASDAISAGAWVGAAATGDAVVKVADEDIVRGVALETASAQGDIIEILLAGPSTLRVS